MDYTSSRRFHFLAMEKNRSLFISTGRKAVFDTITASKRLKEVWMMNDPADLCRAYNDMELET